MEILNFLRGAFCSTSSCLFMVPVMLDVRRLLLGTIKFIGITVPLRTVGNCVARRCLSKCTVHKLFLITHLLVFMFDVNKGRAQLQYRIWANTSVPQDCVVDRAITVEYQGKVDPRFKILREVATSIALRVCSVLVRVPSGPEFP